jgi:hypothetical protein
MLFSTGRTVRISVTSPRTAPQASTSTKPSTAFMPILWMKSAPSTPPSIPSMPAVKLNTRDAENITL